MTKVLIVDVHAEMYRDALQAEFPALQFALFHSAAEVTGDLADMDVMIMFGIELRDHMLSGAPRLKWIQSLATGVDHFLRSPALKPDVLITSGRGIHGPPMREQVVYMMMAVSRDAMRQVEDHQHRVWARRLWSTLHGKTAVIVGTGVVGAAIGELLAAFGMHVVGVSRTPRARKRLRRDHADGPSARGRGQGGLSHQRPAGDAWQTSICSTPRCSPR